MKHRIAIPDGLTLVELKNRIQNGDRLIIYSYCISILFAITLRRFSRTYLILKDEHPAKYKSRYNTLNFIFRMVGNSLGNHPYYSICKTQ